MLLTRIWGKRQRGNLIEADDMPHVLVWDIETVPDLKGFAAANGLDGKSDDEIRTRSRAKGRHPLPSPIQG